jgi:long-chain fatty acid transport protein
MGVRPMKTPILATSISLLALTSSAALAGGLDRSGRPTSLIFEKGNMIELSIGQVSPSISGTDVTNAATGGIAEKFMLPGAGIRYELNDKLSFGLIMDQPFGADVLYGTGSPMLGGTAATVSSTAYTGFLRYRFSENVSVHAGLVYQNLKANVTLGGAAYGDLNGYNAAFTGDNSMGYMVGAAYEIPDIAMRVSLTYHSTIDHDLGTTENIGGTAIAAPSSTRVTTPEAIELKFQSGVAADTLVFGSVRYSHNSETTVSPIGLTTVTSDPTNSLTSLSDSLAIDLGVGRKFNEKWSGSATVGWERKGKSDLVSPLGATNGSTFLALGASYQLNDTTKISGGVRYTKFGDAKAQTADTARATFTGSNAVSAGMRIQFSF